VVTAIPGGSAATEMVPARRGRRRHHKRLAVLPLLAIAVTAAGCGTSAAQQPGSSTPKSGAQAQHSHASQASAQSGSSSAVDPAAGQSGWKLTWSSNFGGPSARSKWLYYSGGTGFGLKQLQWYDAANASFGRNGLVITADKGGAAGHTCWYGPCQYSSARMETKTTFSQTYGEFEARIKFPAGRGLWPAFWIEGANVYQAGWPACGEVDIVEPKSQNPYLVPGYAHATGFKHQAFLTVTKPITAGFHTYGVVWNPSGVTWYFDGHAFSHMKSYQGWPFGKPFFIILDLAIGGSYPGKVTAATPFPAKMTVDWVRVYSRTASG
jgi:beta-glucanase (GH16 family)